MRRAIKKEACALAASKPPISASLMRLARTYSEIIWSVKSGFEERREANTLLGNKNIDEPIVKELSKETGRSSGRIKKFLVQAEYLTKECLAELSTSGADEDFFDAAQQVKRSLVKDMLSRGLTHKQIEGEISIALSEMWQEYQQTGKIDRKRWLKMSNGTSKQKQTWVPGGEAFGKPQILKYRPPNGRGPLPKPPDPKQISRRLEGLATEIRETAQRTDEKRCDPIQEVGRLLTKTIRLHHSLLRGRESEKGEPDYGMLH